MKRISRSDITFLPLSHDLSLPPIRKLLFNAATTSLALSVWLLTDKLLYFSIFPYFLTYQMTAVHVHYQPVYSNLAISADIPANLPPMYLTLFGVVRVTQTLTTSKSPQFINFPAWKYFVAEFTQHLTGTKDIKVQSHNRC